MAMNIFLFFYVQLHNLYLHLKKLYLRTYLTSFIILTLKLLTNLLITCFVLNNFLFICFLNILAPIFPDPNKKNLNYPIKFILTIN